MPPWIVSDHASSRARTDQAAVLYQFQRTSALHALASNPFDKRLCSGIMTAKVTTQTTPTMPSARKARSWLNLPQTCGGLNAVKMESTNSVTMNGATTKAVERVCLLCCRANVAGFHAPNEG